MKTDESNAVIHCRLPESELAEYGRQIGEMLRPHMTAHRYDHACSDMICLGIVSLAGDLAGITGNRYSTVLASVPLMCKWVNYARLARCLRIAVDAWLEPQAKVTFDAAYLNTGIEAYPEAMSEDFAVFAGWAIYRGADGATVRRVIPTSTERSLRTIIKTVGEAGIVNRLWRSLVAFEALAEKGVGPALREALRHGARSRSPMNSMAAAFAAATRNS